VQGPAGAPRQSGDIALGATQQGKRGVGQLQQAQPGAGEANGLALAHEQRQAQALFQLLELV